jgi:hypothetical protein
MDDPASTESAESVADTAPAADLTPHQKFLEMLPEDLREEPSFIDFKGESIEDIVSKLGKSYYSTKKLVGADKGAILKIPSSEDDADGWGEIYDKIGRPEAPEGYELDKLVGDSDFIDKDGLAEITKIAHENGVSKKAMQAIIGKYVEQASGAGAASDEQVEQTLRGYDDALAKEWGSAKDEKLKKIQAVVNKFADDDFKNAVVDNPVIFEHPSVARFLDKVFSGMSEDAGLDGGQTTSEGAMTPPEAKAELARMEGDSATRKILLDSGDPRHDELVQKRTKLFGYAYPS